MKLSLRFVAATREMCELDAPVAAPYLRKTLDITQAPAKAELSICALGFYRFYLDGEELTRGLLSPYISNPDQQLCYDVYDLTDRLTPGRHTLGFQLGNGMQNSFGGYVWNFHKVPWRSAPKMAMCLECTDAEGNVTRLEADETFRCAPSPVQSDDLRQGEVYDARKEIPGWALPDLDDSAWTSALPAATPFGKPHVCKAEPILPAYELKGRILGKYTLRYAKNDTVDEGYLFDFGVNAAGLCRLTVKGEAGQRIGMIFGEYINSRGEFTVDNLRFIRPEYEKTPLYIQKDEYICKGEGTETWMPGFTYHGFRYVLVTGITEAQAKESLLTYVVMNTRLEERGGFSCSDVTLNTLQRMSRVATLANFYHMPTDCPHREKNGWTADALMSVEQTLLNLDPDKNYEEWIGHVYAAMTPEGGIPSIVPTYDWGYSMGPDWEILTVLLPYEMYRYRGDRAMVEQALPYMLRHVNFLSGKRNEQGLIPFGMGDWSAPYGSRPALALTSSLAAMVSCEKAAFLFDQFGRHPQARFCREIAEELRTAVRTHLIDRDTMTAAACSPELNGCQTAQAMCLAYGIFTEEEQPAAYRVLLEQIRREDDRIDVGILGAKVLFRVLSKFGDADLAYRLITTPRRPSFGYWIERGETALVEDFNTEEEGVNSRNHHFFGTLSTWMISDVAGIWYNPGADDLTRTDIRPQFIEALTHAEAYHVCPEGRIDARWERTGEAVTLHVAVPDGLHGEIVSPKDYRFEDGEKCKPLATGMYRLIK